MKSIELFAGAGGLGLGFSQAGFEPCSVVEYDRHCCETLRTNQAIKNNHIAKWSIFEGDVRKIDFRSFDGKLDIVTGGPPCQPFSLGGRHRAEADFRDMFPEAIRAVRETRPKAFVFENVKGLTRATFRSYFEYIKLQLEHPEIAPKKDEDWTDHLARLEDHHTGRKWSGLHYRVIARVLNAANYGVPQRRERVFFVGFRDDVGVQWHFPNPTHSQDALIWDQLKTSDYWERHGISSSQRRSSPRMKARAVQLIEKPELIPWVTTRDAICDLPKPTKDGTPEYPDHKIQAGARSYPGHTGSPIDEPAKTLKAGVHGVPGGENMLRNINGSVRYFTIRESARLQTFPDDFVFSGSWTETMRQLGNAVPVKLANHIASDIAGHLGKAA